MRNKKWVRLLAYVTGSVSQELLLQNEYLAAGNHNLRGKLPSRLRLSDPERATLAEIGKRLRRKALREVTRVAKPDTILAWYRRLLAEKFDGPQHRQYPGRPKVAPELEALVVRMARENSGEARISADVPYQNTDILALSTGRMGNKASSSSSSAQPKRSAIL
jgi:putative transposase